MATFSREEVLKFHQGGKVAVHLPKPLKTQADLCLAYTPGVAQAVKAIAEKPDAVYGCTAKPNLVAVVSDGTAILGLGDLGAAASVPLMTHPSQHFRRTIFYASSGCSSSATTMGSMRSFCMVAASSSRMV